MLVDPWISFYSVVLIYKYKCKHICQYHAFLITVAFVVLSEVWKVYASTFVLFSQDCLAILAPLWFHMMLGGIGAGGEGDDRGWDGWMASLTRWTWVWVNSRSWWWTGRPGCAVIHGVTKSGTRLSDWTEMNWTDKL